MGIKAKILTPAIVIILFVVAAILISNSLQFSDFVDNTTIDRVDEATAVALERLDSMKAEAKAVSALIASDSEIIDAATRQNHNAVLTRAEKLLFDTGGDFCTITDAEGRVIARTHETEVYGDFVISQSSVKSALRGSVLSGIEGGAVVRLAMRAATPIFDGQGAVIGTVSVGYRLDTDVFVDQIKTMMGCETTVVLGEDRIATTVLDRNGTRIIGTQADAYIVESVLTGNTYSGRVDIEGRLAVCKYTPLYDTDNTPVGMLFIGQYFDQELSTIWSFVRDGVIITVILLFVAITILLLITGRIVTPIRAMTEAASALARGDTDLDIAVDTTDEMGTLASAFNSMISNTRRQVEIVESIAGGNLAVTLQERSEKDVMNHALGKLNTTIQAQAAALREEHERIRLMLDATPLVSRLWDRNYNVIECNEAAVKLFGLQNKQEYISRYFELSPEYQPDGKTTREKAREMVRDAFENGKSVNYYLYQLPDGTPIPAEVTCVRVPYGSDYVVAGYSRDLREQEAMLAEIRNRDELLQTVNSAIDILLRSEPLDFGKTLQQCMGMMARAVGADRMRVVKNHIIDGKYYRSLLHEWVENVPSVKDTALTTNISYDEITPKMKEILLRQECLNSRVEDMPLSDQKWFTEQGVLSTLLVPVFVRNEFWGFVGFDNCHDDQLFNDNDVSIMRSGGMIIVNALLRVETIMDLRDTSSQLEVALDDAKEANNAKSNFLARMSHEIRTPLNAVIGLSELMIGGETPASETESNLEKIYGAGSTILSIVNDLLDISKIESGNFQLYPAQYDTPSLINDIVTLNIVRIEEKPITFKLFVDEDLPGTLLGDDLRVKQIFNNLLSNAFKYTNAGTIEWRIAFERDGDDIWLVSSVRDTGIGMNPEDLQRLYLDYSRLHMSGSHRVEGTGLGLPITKNLVEMMDGVIMAESELGKGSVFSVRLRQTYVSGAPIGRLVAENLMGLRYTLSRRAKNKNRARTNLSYAHLLIVDDIMTNLDVVKGMLKPYKVNIDCAISGEQAIEMIRAENPRYSAVFMDHMMPGMDGIEAARIIREEIGTAYAQKIPIIALTANAILGNEEMFLNHGFQDFLSKPIDMAKLDAALRRWVRDKNKEKLFSESEEEEMTTEESPDAAKRIPLSLDMAIRGVNVPKALERFGGDKFMFLDVLRSYALNTRPLITILSQSLLENNLAHYAIVIHGIKGSSYGILALDVGRHAEELETTASAGNLEAVQHGHTAFEKNLSSLLDEIDAGLATIDRVMNKPIMSNPAPQLLSELCDACAAFDMDRVDAAMEQLESFRYEKGEKLVAWLREQVNNMAFEAISDPSRWDRNVLDGEDPQESFRDTTVHPPFTAPEADVLLVEDNETNLTMALGFLKPLNMRIATAKSGEEALRLLEENRYHLVLMDYKMPGMGGESAIKKLRQTEGEYHKTVPVIALCDGREAAHLLKAGMNDFVEKPIGAESLWEKVRAWLPKELLRKTEDIHPNSLSHVSENADLPVIDAIDTQVGLGYSRTKELYLSLLKDFYRLIDSKASKIEQYLEDERLYDLSIEAHALKNTARIVGAAELSEAFSRLEQYGEKEDLEALKSEVPAVLQEYRNLKPALAPFAEVGEQEKRMASRDEFIQLLRDIASAMNRFDVDDADVVLRRLETLRIPLKHVSQVDELRALVADVSIEKAVALAEAMIETMDSWVESYEQE